VSIARPSCGIIDGVAMGSSAVMNNATCMQIADRALACHDSMILFLLAPPSNSLSLSIVTCTQSRSCHWAAVSLSLPRGR